MPRGGGHGRANGDEELGIYRSTDDGASFQLISTTPMGIYRDITVVTGNLSIPGRVQVGFAGVGAVYGDPS